MIFLLDTTALSDLMREHVGMMQRLARTSATDRVVVCSIVRGEILFGIERLPEGNRRTHLADKASRVFAAVRCEAVPKEAGDHYARIKVVSQRKGLVLDENDLWIAATALSLAATLVSRDSDFWRVDGLNVVDWT
jgi:predicted nucleic acid-binding protein